MNHLDKSLATTLPPLAVNRCHLGDALELAQKLPDESIQCIIASPPYWALRNYGAAGQIGLEKEPQEYIAKLVEVFGELRRALRANGTLWLVLGDTYACNRRIAHFILPCGNESCQARQCHKQGLQPKNLLGIPWHIAFALQRDGWILRSEIIWHKSNPLPESVTDRPSTAHEHIFLLTKSKRYHYCAEAIAEPLKESTIRRYQTGWHGNQKRDYPNGLQNHFSQYMGSERAKQRRTKNRGTVWSISQQPSRTGHHAVFPPALVEPCILAGCPPEGIVLDPFAGSGTTLVVAESLGRKWMGFEINPEYVRIVEERLAALKPGRS